MTLRLVDSDGWQPLATAPRDGTLVTLTWFEKGIPQEVFRSMSWNPFGRNLLVQHLGVDAPGLWELRDSAGNLVVSWVETENGPTHWRLETFSD